MFDPLHDCCSGSGLRHYTDCLEDMFRETKATPAADIPVARAIGLTLAEDITAPISLPGFDNSAMDGFAFASGNTIDATIDQPVHLKITGTSVAGNTEVPRQLPNGQAAKIMTGAPMPKGADTVLPVEAASWSSKTLTFHTPYPEDKHVRRVGQDVQQGSMVLSAGTVLRCQHLPLLCALGVDSVIVRPLPSAVWISTGQELVDNFKEPLATGQIYNATRMLAEAGANNFGFTLKHAVTVNDTLEDFSAELEKAVSAAPTIILSTGGVSAGQFDFVRPVLEEFGAKVIFHKASIKPAKPVLFAVLPNGTYFFGLPGNPISTALALRLFVYPFARGLAGQQPEAFQTARLTRDVRTAVGKTVFLMGCLEYDDYGTALVTPHQRQQSFQTQPFSECNAWLMVPEGVADLKAGEKIQWCPFTPSTV